MDLELNIPKWMAASLLDLYPNMSVQQAIRTYLKEGLNSRSKYQQVSDREWGKIRRQKEKVGGGKG